MDSLQEALDALTHKHYGLAFLLLPDDLMAAQLLIDAVARMMALAPADLWNFKEGRIQDTKEISTQDSESMESDFLYHLVELARIRQQHFASKRSEVIYKLSLDERVVLFLRDKRHYEVSFVARVLNTREENILALTHKARALLLEQAKAVTPEVSQFL